MKSCVCEGTKELTAGELDALEDLFDGEFRKEFGVWNPDAPYGYSPADTHVLAFRGPALAAHVIFRRRLILVGSEKISVAGMRGVLVHERYRGTGIGQRTVPVPPRPNFSRHFRERAEPHVLRQAPHEPGAARRHRSSGPLAIKPTREVIAVESAAGARIEGADGNENSSGSH